MTVGTRFVLVLGLWAACAGLVACGSAGKATTSATSANAFKIPKPKAPLKAPSRPGIDDTYDEDETAARTVENHDDKEIEIYGKPATPAEWQATEAFARGYFAAAAAEDGARACPMLAPWLGPTLGGSYEKPSDPSYLHGKTCAEVMTKLFTHRHGLVVKEARGVEVTDVRVTQQTAFVLLAFKGVRERRYMGLQRMGANKWTLEALTDSPYP